jgi:DNA-directed RNA polymerase subunit alpha
MNNNNNNIPNNEGESILDLPLEELNFTVRSYNCLKRDNIRTLGDIIKIGPERLRTIKHLGEKSVVEIEEMVKQYGFENKDCLYIKK